MAQIYVKSDRMAACGVQYGKHAKQLAAAEDAIRAVRKKLDSALWEKAGVKQRLKKAADACDDGFLLPSPFPDHDRPPFCNSRKKPHLTI